ncbi:MAG: hypothetical protein OXC01_18985 [Immundisolibacterales bacterium]|nr:hypothetical protein [Immundisolibacterales bacterium]
MNATESERLSAGDRVGYLPSLMLMMRTALEAGPTGYGLQRLIEGLAWGEDVSIVRFGRFSRTDRPAREGRNGTISEVNCDG